MVSVLFIKETPCPSITWGAQQKHKDGYAPGNCTSWDIELLRPWPWTSIPRIVKYIPVVYKPRRTTVCHIIKATQKNKDGGTLPLQEKKIYFLTQWINLSHDHNDEETEKLDTIYIWLHLEVQEQVKATLIDLIRIIWPLVTNKRAPGELLAYWQSISQSKVHMEKSPEVQLGLVHFAHAGSG